MVVTTSGAWQGSVERTQRASDVPSTREKRYLVTGEPVFRAKLRKP